MDQPFYYRSAEDRVPWDAVHVIVCGSVRVVPRGAFQFNQNLERVEFQEGVEVIGMQAFLGCPNLAHVDFPSSLCKIDHYAFHLCQRLSKLILREGLRTIENFAFAGCGRLSELILGEGLRRIGERAFNACAFERITVPSSVVEIGVVAFWDCNNLEAATLAGGMVMVARGAFSNCRRLDQIAIPSMAIVVKAGEDGNGRATAVTGGIERDPSLWVEGHEEDEDDEDEELEPAQLILTSRYLALMGQEDRTKFTDAIDQITDEQTRGAGPLDLGDEGVADLIRRCFADCLAEYKTSVAAVLELALWRANMNQNREASQARTAEGGKRARIDAPTRDDCRRTCGVDVVIGPVLSYLWGPHRRANQENSGLIQL